MKEKEVTVRRDVDVLGLTVLVPSGAEWVKWYDEVLRKSREDDVKNGWRKA